MAVDITPLLLSALSVSAEERTGAEIILKQFEKLNRPDFLLSLSVELSTDGKPNASRCLAGIILKNLLHSKDAVTKAYLVQQWGDTIITYKSHIKGLLLHTMGSSVHEARHAASQVIAKIASIEIPQKAWPDLVESLLVNMTEQDKPVTLKQATLETLGYVCEEITHIDLVEGEVNLVLGAIVKGMNGAEESVDVRLTATRALNNALKFAQTKFQNDGDRDIIMKVVSETAMTKETLVRQAAFECLVSIASMYYDVLEPYMQKIQQLTADAVKEDKVVGLQAIEFWSSICDQEIKLQNNEVPDTGVSEVQHSCFIKKALSSLVPLLLENLQREDEDPDQDDGIRDCAMASRTCLCLVTRTVKDAIVPLVMPFVNDHINDDKWRAHEASIYALGSILEGPCFARLYPMFNTGLNHLLRSLININSYVRDTAAWTISRIFEFFPAARYSVITRENLPQVVEALFGGLNDAPHISEKVCGAIYYLAQGYEDAGTSSSLLTPHLEDIIARLIRNADRTDGGDSNLESVSYETLNEVVRCSNLAESSEIIAQLLLQIMYKLANTCELQIGSAYDREKQVGLQASLCRVVGVIIQKLGGAEKTNYRMLQNAKGIMYLFYMVFDCRSSTIHEEAMHATGALAYAIGPGFCRYMPEFCKYLEIGLQNIKEYEVCSISVGVVGDICRALEERVLQYCDGIMYLLLDDLKRDELHHSVKPPIFSCFGDIALAIGEHFEKYFEHVVPMMRQTAAVLREKLNPDEEMMECDNQLRRRIFEAYSGILQVFKNTKAHLILPHVHDMLMFIESVSNGQIRDETVIKAAVELLGDIADALGPEQLMLFQVNSRWIDQLLLNSLRSNNEKLKVTARWTKDMIARLTCLPF